MARQKRPTFPARYESADQAEEREARITEILERVKRHNANAQYHQRQADHHRREAARHTELARQKKAEG
jgi:hypothetical protein